MGDEPVVAMRRRTPKERMQRAKVETEHLARVRHLLCTEALDWSRNTMVRAEAIRAAVDERLDALVRAVGEYGCEDAREQVREMVIRWAARAKEG